MLKFLFSVLVFTLIAQVIHPGLIIGAFLGVFDFMLFRIEWWQAVIILLVAAFLIDRLCKLIKKAKK